LVGVSGRPEIPPGGGVPPSPFGFFVFYFCFFLAIFLWVTRNPPPRAGGPPDPPLGSWLGPGPTPPGLKKKPAPDIPVPLVPPWRRINLANEQLQSHYNKCVFERDMVEYRSEGLPGAPDRA